MARGGRDTQQQQQQFQQQRWLPCHHYQRGHCSYGDSCKYSHDVPQFAASSSTAGGTAGAASHPGHSRTGSAGSSASGGGGGSRVRADGLAQGQPTGTRAPANTQDLLLSVEALARLGEQSVAPSAFQRDSAPLDRPARVLQLLRMPPCELPHEVLKRADCSVQANDQMICRSTRR